MKRLSFIASILFASFLGGAFAQTINGAVFTVAHAGLNYVSNIVYSGTSSASNSALMTSVTASGTATDTFSSPLNGTVVSSDTINQSGGGSVDGLLVDHSFGGAAVRGGRTGLNVRLQQTATTGNTTAAYVGLSVAAWGEANDTGISGTPHGSVFGINPQCILNGGATFFARCTGGEVDVTVATGASVAHKLGLEIVQASADKVAGTSADIGLSIANQTGAIGWTCGFCFGTADGIFPTTTTGTLIGVWGNSQTSPGTVYGTALYGVDFSGVTFSTGGSPFLAPLITPVSSSATCKQGSIEWDAGFVYICTATNTWKRATLASF